MNTPYDYDVVIVGFGAAGACAAIAAAESGAKVLVVDRALGGGASALSGGVVYAGGGTRYQQEAGCPDDAENMFEYLRQEVQGVVDDETLRQFCDGSVERLSWLEKHGAQFDSSLCEYKTSYPTDRHYLYYSGNEKAYPYNQYATPAPRGHRQVAKGMNSGRVLWERLRDAALGLGVTVLPATRVDELIIEDGQVRGIRGRTMPIDNDEAHRYRRLAYLGAKLTNWVPAVGKSLNRLAEREWAASAEVLTVRSPTVILSAGGFVFNRDMTRELAPAYNLISPLGTEGDDGKGIALGVSAGGTTAQMERVTAWRFLSPPAAMLEGIAVGVNGKRIANEDLYGATHAEIMVTEHGGKGYLIADSAIWRRARAQVRTQTLLFQRAQLASVFTTGHRKANSLSELADKLGISASGLAASVAEYNDAIASGTGDPAHKAAQMCAPIEEGPFYGIDISLRESLAYFVPGLTLGGLRVAGTSGLVLDRHDSPIAGLYAAGRTAVGICSRSYVSGLALADCVFSGQRAGQHAALSVVGDSPAQDARHPASVSSET
ncbi:FAD-binding protein [Williamsia sp. DF01-3]|uniref:FAD-binding protein n=1 Tax=Williamsia sp. DF01-3 TaxID=2934157 RepID=UPI001FF2CC59|nr:FAD-binding protein [Williamsia sp. DF01-3]MCK0516701.1 FAD-binding protein [Williamsia sp. DF01-3]